MRCGKDCYSGIPRVYIVSSITILDIAAASQLSKFELI